MSVGGGSRGPFDFDPSRVPKLKIPKIPGGTILAIIVGLVLLVTLYNGVYKLEPDEVGVVLRFGKYIDQTDPGLHFLVPYVETVIKVPVERQLKAEFGFRAVQPGARTDYRQGAQFFDESLMLTGDLNVAVVEWIVQFKIKDPYAYLFNVQDAIPTFRDMSEASMRAVVGDHSVDEVLTIGREQVAMQSRDILQNLVDTYEMGIDVQRVVLQDVNPPDPVRPSFNEVNQAIQQKERLTNEARTEYNQAIPKARGEAQQLIQEAEGYATERVNRSLGEVARFEAIYEEYRKAPRVTRNRMYLEMLSEVLPRLGSTVIVDEDAASVLPLLDLTKGEKQ